MRGVLDRFVSVTTLAVSLTMVAGRQSVNAQGATAVPLGADDAIGMRTFAPQGEARLSRDARWVAYVLVDRYRNTPTRHSYTETGVPWNAVGAELWVTNTISGESYNLTGNNGVSWAPSWSPDGRLLAFYSDRGGRAQLWVWEAATRCVRRVSREVVRPYYGWNIPRWTPDGRSVLVKMLAGEAAAGGRGRSGRAGQPIATVGAAEWVQVFRAANTDSGASRPDSTEALVQMADLALVSIATSEVRRILRDVPVASYWLSPDGTHAAVTVARGMSSLAREDWIFDLAVIDLSTGGVRTLAPSIPQNGGNTVSWSPDGSALAYTVYSFVARERNLPTPQDIVSDCYVVSAAGGPPKDITPGRHPPLAEWYQGPLWDTGGHFVYLLGGDTLWRAVVAEGRLEAVGSIPGRQLRAIVAPVDYQSVFSPDGGRSLLVRTRDPVTLRVGFARIDLATGRSRLIVEENVGETIDPAAGYRFLTDIAGRVIIYERETASVPPELWIADADSNLSGRRQLTRINPALNRYVLGTSRLIEWRSLDGVPLKGALLLPAGYIEGKRYPLVLWVYGGARLSTSLNRFGLGGWAYELQMLATRGYVVLAPDAPQGTATPMWDMAKTILPAVDKLVDLGIADSARVGVMGHSFGGYATLALLVETTRFRAGIAMAGVGNLLTEYGHLDADGYSFGVALAESGQGLMGDSPWAHRDRYIENSPYFYLDRIETPILLIQGAGDETVPPYGANELFTGLRRLGKEVEYARYLGVDHNFSQMSVPQLEDLYQRVGSWFDTHLGASGPAQAREALPMGTSAP